VEKSSILLHYTTLHHAIHFLITALCHAVTCVDNSERLSWYSWLKKVSVLMRTSWREQQNRPT